MLNIRPTLIKKLAVLLLIIAGSFTRAEAQFSITGPTCVTAGQSYQYTISGPWTFSTYMNWQLTGGVFTGTYNSSQTGTPMPNVSVTWSSSGTIHLTTSNPSGSVTVNVTVTTALVPGTISNTSQNINYNSVPATIYCSLPTGGYCSPSYTYQWQSSADNVNFTDVSGATSQNFTPTTPLTQTTYFRRKVTETHGPTIGYSNTATVFVYPQLIGGSIGPSSQSISFNGTPATLTISGVSGGTNSYTFLWESSVDNNTWTSIYTATSTIFAPPALTNTMYYRVQVASNGVYAYSAVATISVNAQLFGGSVSPSYLSFISGNSPGPIINLSPAFGGNCGSYAYQWQSSSDGFNYTDISGATSANYTPGTLSATTWFRRKATCGSDVAYGSISQAILTTTADLNYVRVRGILKAGVADSATAYGLSSAYDVVQTTQYFDGLGRPLQTVAKMQSPLQKDLVSYSIYDQFGREPIKWLPYVATTSDGNFKPGAYKDGYDFNNTQFSGEQYYYSREDFENSPLNRPSLTSAPGLNWVGAGRGVGSQFLLNTTADSVHIWTIASSPGSIPTTSNSAIYGNGLLLKSLSVDEQGHQVVEYKDKGGKVILKKVQLSASPGTAHAGWLCTYYVYDDMDQLRFVIPPLAVQLINSSWSITTTIANELCFRYEYDSIKRMIIKKVPGAGETWMVYDARDRLVMSQDSLLRLQGKWAVTEYDSLNRPWRTGLFTNSSNRAYHQNLASTSISYPNTSSNYEVLTQTYYDDYSWASAAGLPSTMATSIAGNSSYFITSYNVSPVYAVNPVPLYITRGMVTGVKTEVLGSGGSQYLYAEKFYDDHGREVQSQSINYTGGIDTLTSQYDFSGKPLRMLAAQKKNGTNAQAHRVLTKMTYDAGGRLLTIAKNIDNASSDQTIATNTYNELGQLSNKQLGNNIENLAYAYNIRGWLTSINKNYLLGSGSNYFGMELGYDKTTAAVSSTSYATPTYNGNIEGTIWKSKGDGIARKYDFTYDNVNKLTAANFLQNSSGSTWDNSYLNFTVNNLSYDANGNIMTMNQYGFKVNGSGLIDQLTYTYQTNSNKLIKVDDVFNDAGSKLGDFHYTGTKGSYDYSYDGNGNLVLDNNKAISSITYNPLNLPNQVSVTNKGTISYTYDAAGDKLKKTTVEGAKTTTTLYLGGTVYQNDTLQFISHEEGRTRWALHHYVNGSTAYGFEYDYFLKDHLGNVRMVLTQEKDTAQYIATMEAAYRNTENQLFYNIPLTSYARSAVSGYPTDNTTVPNDSLARVNGNGPKTGPSLLLKVMSGDVVDIATKSFYKSGGTVTSPNSILSDVINSLAGGIVTATSGAHGMVTDLTNSTSGPVYAAVNSFLPTNDPDMVGKPKAYLNWILLDDQFKGVTTYPQSGAIAVGSADVLNTLAYSGIPITKNGYLYIWVSNETPGWDVFFDNLSVKQYSGPVTEETHYYPFGLTMAGISDKGAGGIENKHKYNGKELQHQEFSDGSGLEEYDYGARFYDCQIGRWNTIDPAIEKDHYSWSPYAYVYDNAIRLSDPDGKDTIQRAQALAKAREYVEKKKPGNQYLMGAKGKPGEKIDCSGLGSACIKAGGEPDPNHGNGGSGVVNSENNTKKIDLKEVKPGNLITFRHKGGYAYHEGIVSDVQKDKAGNPVTIKYIQSSGGVGPNENSFNVKDGGPSPKTQVFGYYKWDTKPDATTSTTSTEPMEQR